MKILLFLVSGMFLLASCSVLNPYEEKGYCDAKQVKGYCGSMSDVYKKIKEEQAK